MDETAHVGVIESKASFKKLQANLLKTFFRTKNIKLKLSQN